MSIKDSILSREFKPELVPLAAVNWGDVFVKPMNAGEVDAYEGESHTLSTEGKMFVNFRSRLLVRVIVDKDGKRIFTDEDAEQLSKLPPSEVKAAFEFAAPLCQLTKEDVRELEKN